MLFPNMNLAFLFQTYSAQIKKTNKFDIGDDFLILGSSNELETAQETYFYIEVLPIIQLLLCHKCLQHEMYQNNFID